MRQEKDHNRQKHWWPPCHTHLTNALLSFQQQTQLNLYDFQRVTEGVDKGSYYHELFVQGRLVLSTMMKRNKIKGVNGKNAGIGMVFKKKVSIPAINNDNGSHSTEDESETA